MARPLKVFWLHCGPRAGNFGDNLTPLLLDYLCVDYRWSPPEAADLIGIGSLCEKVPEGYSGMVWTSGCLYGSTRVHTEHAEVLALRGRLTLGRAPPDLDSIPLGDGGLVAGLMAGQEQKQYALGLIPHYAHERNPAFRAVVKGHSRHACLIDICSDPRSVIQQVQRCEAVLASCLHGLVLADSLGVPSQWVMTSDALLGADFKFRDYYSVFGNRSITPLTLSGEDSIEDLVGSCSLPDSASTAEITRRLLEALRGGLGVGQDVWSFVSQPTLEREITLRQHINDALDQDECNEGPILRGDAQGSRSLSQEIEASSEDGSRLSLLFRKCLTLLERLWPLGVNLCLLGPEDIWLRDGRPLLANLGWACPGAYARKLNEGVSPSELRHRDLRRLGQLFAELVPSSGAAFGSVLRLVAGGQVQTVEEAMRLTEAAQAADQADPADLASGRTAKETEPAGTTAPVCEDSLLITLLGLVADKEREVLRLRGTRKRLETELSAFRQNQAKQRLAEVIPTGGSFILVDEGEWGEEPLVGRKAIPFPERNGWYAGRPSDGPEAAAELQRLLDRDPSHVVFSGACTWWLDYYAELEVCLSHKYERVTDCGDLIVFDLRSGWTPTEGGT